MLDEFGEQEHPDIAERIAIAQAQLEEERDQSKQNSDADDLDEIEEMFDELPN